ncbi:hypothetical protein niasHT_003809 [Heterodera trifolii]|uniref:Pecanex-like protein n=1 Tax=Heterodera trifolii TaxID=157864 RepID=A0ABD2LUX7_9BILA
MAFGGHIANIAREGIWASLTGGWYYEPANSLFCNTLHLYIWSILFVLPILFGLSIHGTNEQHNYGHAIIYLSLLGFLFVFIKMSVAFLHHIFDTVQPIKYKSKKNTDGLQDKSQKYARGTRFSGSSISATRPIGSSNALEAIEMVDIRRNINRLRNEADTVNTEQSDECKTKMDDENTERERKGNREAYYHSLPSFGHSNRNSPSKNKVDNNQNDDACSSRSSASASELCSDNFLPNPTNRRRKGRHSVGVELANTADSFGLLSKNNPPFPQQKQRKFSEPIGTNRTNATLKKHSPDEWHETFGQNWQSERCKNIQKASGRSTLRRNNSTKNPRELRRNTTREDEIKRRATNLALGVFVDGIEMDNTPNQRREREYLLRDIFMSGAEMNPSSVFSNKNDLIENQQVKHSDIDHETGVSEIDSEQQEPCCSSSLFTTPNVPNTLINSENKEESTPKKDPQMPDSIRESSVDFVMNASEAEDLKGQITKFLEDLIAKHPEAMDAIESVRMNRLMKRGTKALNGEDNRTEKDEQTFLHSDNSNEGNADTSCSYNQSHHLEINPIDTSPGAVHAFQDEHGNWLTYWFGPKSSDTVQPFMNVPSSLDKSKHEKRKISSDNSNNGQSYKEQPTVVNVIDTSSARDVEKGQTRHRLSISSSSDNESFSSEEHPTESDKKLPAENSSSSDEASRYIKPMNLLRTNVGTTDEPTDSKAEPTARESQMSSDSSSHLTLMQRLCHLTTGELEPTPRVVSHSRTRSLRLPMVTASNVLERMEGSPFRLLNDLQMGRPLPSGLLFYHSVRDALHSRPRQKYCYRLILPNWLNWWPFGREKGVTNCNESLRRAFTLKLDRLSLITIFDRNSSVVSSIFDILLALSVGLLAILMLYRRVYTEVSLLFFSFTVAGAQFSLLKSVQPDSASPVHGFNWLVAYSRPIYFLILSSLILFLDWTNFSVRTSLDWHPSWLRLYSDLPLRLSLHDFCVGFLLFLPLVFTFGLLPQVNTLCMHLLEQFDTHCFGATASLSLLSSIFSVCRSVLSVTVLLGVLTIVQLFSPDDNFVSSVGFSVFVSLTNAFAYLLSRESSAHQFVKLLWDAIWLNVTATNTSAPAAARNKHNAQKEKQHQLQQHSSQLTLNGQSQSKQLLSCCIFTNEGDNSVERRRPEKEGTEEEKTTNGKGEEKAEEQRTKEHCPTQQTLILRAQHNLFSATLRFLLFFGMHRTLLFQTGQPLFQVLLSASSFLLSLLNHHFYPQMRAKNPWKIIARPIFRSHEFDQFEPTKEAKLTHFEKIHVWMISSEKNVLLPLLVISLMSTSGMAWSAGYFPILVLTICAFRLARTGYAQPNLLRLPLLISWGSAFHAFAQPFSIPHSGLTLAQALLSSILSAPLNPFLGSSFFLMSYIRPIKFWERDYNTKRIDHSKLRLASQLDRSPMIDDSNLNSIFYEHLTRSLQISLAGDLLLGRWACTVQPGDCFVLSSNYLNCMIHLVECGNGFVTFQLRGLEFRGTYCHQREMEAISEDWAENNATFFTVAKYVVDGYSISDNSAVNMLQIHELRRLLVSLYVKCMIFYAIDSPQLSVWLADDTVLTALDKIHRNPRFVDFDPVFCAANDEDFDINLGGLSHQSFTLIYAGWIEFCLKRKSADTDNANGCNSVQNVSLVTSFCFALSMLGRRALGTAAYNRHSSAAESFLFGMHTLFKGDMRIAHPSDEWVFADLDILNSVVSSAIRMALKLHQDHFAAVVDLDESSELFELIDDYRKRLFISHEHDPEWRRAILANKPSLLALRHICDDGQQGDYKIIMLNKRHLDMRVIKLNRECVRAFWAGQQQELIFLRNKNPERGSIQNARQVLRNIINSSADQPIGYPIYVSPLTTSFVETHNQLGLVLGPSLTFNRCTKFFRALFGRVRANFGSSGGSAVIPTSSLHQQSQGPPSAVPLANPLPSVAAVDTIRSSH